jgi:acetyl esterase/lipase
MKLIKVSLFFLPVFFVSLTIAKGQTFEELKGADIRVYKHASDVDLKISIVYPDDYQAGKKYPAIVFFFGGGWKGGTVQQFAHHCEYLASRGMIAMTANYRVASRNGTTPVDAVEDARSAMRWIKSSARELGIKRNKIVAAGGSAGGHLALTTATLEHINASDDDLSVSPMPNAMVLFNPVANTMPEGYGWERLGDRAKELSPYHHISEKVPPTIIFHGDADTTVPISNVEGFCKVMKEKGNRCELIVYEGQKHAFFNYGREDHKYYKLTVAEMDTFLQSIGFLSKKEVVEVIP